jgi:hypothetical protein
MTQKGVVLFLREFSQQQIVCFFHAFLGRVNVRLILVANYLRDRRILPCGI